MKIKFTLIDDNNKEFSGEVELKPVKPSLKKPEILKEKKYSGLRGGIEYLIDNDFFQNLRSSKETHAELKKENYFHSLESVDKRLRFLVSKKLLTRVKDDNIWKYAIRK